MGYESNRMARFKTLHPHGRAPIAGEQLSTYTSEAKATQTPANRPFAQLFSTLLQKVSRQ